MRASGPVTVSLQRLGGSLLLAALLTIGIAGAARAAELAFSGTLELHLATLPKVSAPGSTAASVSVTGTNHLASLALPAGAFGPLTTSIPITNNSSLPSIIFTSIENLTGSFPGISGGPPGGGTMGISGTAKICLIFAPCQYAGSPVPAGAHHRWSGLRDRRHRDRSGSRGDHHAERALDDRPAGDDDPHPEQQHLDPGAARRLRPRPGLADLQHRHGRGRAPDGDRIQGVHQPDRRLPRAARLRASSSWPSRPRPAATTWTTTATGCTDFPDDPGCDDSRGRLRAVSGTGLRQRTRR